MATPTGATIVRKAADETVNNNTMQDDNDLLIAVAANEVWYFEVLINYSTTAAPGIQFAWTIPSGATIVGTVIGDDSALADDYPRLLALNTTPVGFEPAGGRLVLKGILRVSSTAGNLQLQWAQETTNAADTKVLADSWMIGVKEA